MKTRDHALWFLFGCIFVGACGDAELPLGPDRDGDGWPEALDCEDGDPSVFPGADDVPGDGIDQDCSGSDAMLGPGVGGGFPCALGDCGGGAGASGADGTGGGSGGGETARDADGDGHEGAPAGDDCDDQRPDVHPDAREVVLNGVDENCDGSDLVGGDDVIPILSLEATPAAPPDLAAGTLGGASVLLAVWSDSRTAPGQDLYGQLLDTTGDPIGSEIAIETADNAAKSGVRIASGAGGFLVTWATAEGVWARPLGPNGAPSGIALAFGGPGATDPVAAFAADHWAVAWRVPAEQRAEVRAMTLEGARGDIYELGSGAISAVSLTGAGDGFVAAWEGVVDGAVRGILAQRCTSTGFPEGSPAVLFEGAASSPAVASSAEEILVAFSSSGSFGHAAAARLDAELQPQGSQLRLSTESVGQFGFRSIGLGEGFAVLWNDARHLSHVPPADSIYGNIIGDGPKFASGMPYLAGESAQLGGLALTDKNVSHFFVVVLTRAGASKADRFRSVAA